MVVSLGNSLRRATDVVARYGGEEFVAILRDTPSAGALTVAETMREAVKQLSLPHRASSVGPHLTISLGGATMNPADAESGHPSILVKEAHEALYRAKEKGRDRVEH